MRASIAFAASVLTLLVADRAIGWARGPVVKPVDAMGLTTGVSEAGTYLRPGFDGRYSNAEFSISIHVSSLGLRGPEIPVRKPAGEYRVLALGDSFTFGQGVEYDQAWPALVERRLGAPVRVVNAGWAAGSPLGYERYLGSRGFQLEPDLVIVAVFVGNDVVEDMAERYAGPEAVDRIEYESRYVTNLRVRVGPVGAIRQLFDDLLPNVYELSTLAIVKAQYLFGSHRGLFDYVLADASDPELAAGWADTFATLARLDGAVASRGGRLGIVVIPFYDQVAPTAFGPGLTRELPQRRIMSFCGERGIPCLDLLPVLERSGDPASLYFIKDGHWTPRGHQAAAAAIDGWLREQRLVPLP